MFKTLQKAERSALIRQNKPILCQGLTFYPIMMDHYEEFKLCEDSLLLRMATLPVRYAVLDYFTAIFAMEIDTIKEHGAKIGIFDRLMRLFFLSLRIDRDVSHFIKEDVIIKYNGSSYMIESFKVRQGENLVSITPRMFSSHIRPLLAEINGLTLPDDSQNIEIIESSEMKKHLKSRDVKLDININDLVASVAYLSHVSEQDILRWSVREFEARKRAIDRDKRYMLYNQAELSGMVSFKNGNPFASWCFDAIDDTYGTMSIEQLGKQTGNFEKNNKGEK